MRNLLAILGLFLVLATPLPAEPLIQPNDRLAICGDSITAQHIYSAFMEDYLLMCQPTEGLSVVQLGWSGEKAPGFLSRLDTDVFPFKPTVATTCYGMNDGLYKAYDPAVAEVYRQAQTHIVEAFKKAGLHAIVIGSSKCVDSFTYRGGAADAAIYNKTLGEFAGIDRDIAAKEGIVYADVFGDTMDAMKKAKAEYGEKYNFGGPDGVHPGANGHLVMAYAFLKALGYDGAIGTLTVDLDSGKAEGTDGQKILSFQDGQLALESTRYPFCFTGPSTNPALTDADILSCVPFNQDLNRYELVVKGLKTPRAKITWGGQSKDFSAADLAQGINLAAEFLANPFGGQFAKVDAAVHAQQNEEQTLVQYFLHNLKGFKAMAPEGTSDLDQIAAEGMARREKLFEAARALVIPIQHTIKIEPEA
jgi:lysophospholipase L1-like esterase